MIRRHQFPEQPLTGFRYCVIPVALSSPLIPFSNATALTVPQAALPSLTTLLSILPFEPLFFFLQMVFWDTFPRLRHMAAMLVLTHTLSLFFSVSLSFSLFATILCKDFSIKCLHHILLLITKHLQKSFSLAYCAPFCKLVLDSTAGTVNISIALLKTIVCNIFLAKTFVHIFSPNFQSLETPSDAIPPFVHPISLN